MLAALPGLEADARAKWTDGTVGLGWRGETPADATPPERLPVVDAGAGLAVTASARLDDRDSLCEALGVPRSQRGMLPDAALILRAYRRWGRECPQRLFGDYAFAVWDAKSRTLFCARDHIGARPFYYSLAADRIVFAGDIGGVLAAPGVPDDLDEPTVATRLVHSQWSFGEHTFYRAIRMLLPGHSLLVKSNSARVERWWRPENAPRAPAGDDDTLAEAFLDLYSRAVEDRVHGAQSVGVHLSGGIDSSSIAVLATRALRRAGRAAPVAFSWQPPPREGPRDAADSGEHDLIEAVCRQEELEVCYCPPTAEDLVAYLRRDGTRDLNVHLNEEPVQRQAARRGVRVLLSGWGGDEGISFNGRGHHGQLLRSGHWGRLWREVSASSQRPLANILLNAVLPVASPSLVRAVRAVREVRNGRRPLRNRTFIHPAFARRVRPLPPPPPEPVGVRSMQLHLLRLGHLGTRIDGWTASGARRGIEYRYPLLDRRVLEFALGLPPEQFRRARWSRWLMRHAVSRIVPPSVCWNRDKRDPVRSAANRDPMREARSAVRDILVARSAPPPRSVYLDLPRLIANLHAEKPRGDTRRGAVTSALRFLDF